MKKIFIRVFNTLTIVIALTVFALANQNSLPEQATDVMGDMFPSSDNFAKAIAAFGAVNEICFYLRTGCGHEGIVPAFCHSDKGAPGAYCGDSISSICLWKFHTGNLKGFTDAGDEVISRSISVCRVTSPLHRATCIGNVRTPARSIECYFSRVGR